jgi:UPF0042 nucleotide-binding protein
MNATSNRPSAQPGAQPDLAPVPSVQWTPEYEWVKVRVYSFGYLWHPDPATLPHQHAAVTVDLRHLLRNPFDDPSMRELTGLEPRVQDYVLNTPGARTLIDATAELAMAAVQPIDAAGLAINVQIGCAGGRHRSVVLANAVCHLLNHAGVGADVEHYDVLRPVYQHPAPHPGR